MLRVFISDLPEPQISPTMRGPSHRTHVCGGQERPFVTPYLMASSPSAWLTLFDFTPHQQFLEKMQVMQNVQLTINEFAGCPVRISCRTNRCRSRPPSWGWYCRSTTRVQSHVSKGRQSDLKAIVIGGGFAGLSAAAGLSRQFSQVVYYSALVHVTCVTSVCAYQSGVLGLQTLLDRDHISDPAKPPESGNPEDWQQYYDVCTVSATAQLHCKAHP